MDFEPWIARQVSERPHGEALVWQGRCVDWRELDDGARLVARRLAPRVATANRTLAVLAAPSLRLIELLHAAQRANLTLLPLPPRATASELVRLLRHAQPQLLLHDTATEACARQVAAEIEVACLDMEHGLDRIEPGEEIHCLPNAEHPLLIVYTSGTTGAPKAVPLRNCQLEAAARAVLQRLETNPGERWLAAMPMHHVGGLSIPLRAAIGGLSVVLQPGFVAEQVLQSLRDERIAWVSLVPTMLARLLECDVSSTAATTLRAAILGGGRLPAALVERAVARGWRLVATYGMSETAAQVTTSHVGDAAAYPGSAGHPLTGVEVQIAAPDADGIGDILVRAPQVFAGYLGNPERSHQALRDGWLHTGDLGRLDTDGRLWVVTRRTDLIVTGGENVRPEEVEDVLLEHPDIADAGVFAVEDDLWGQRVAAAIVERQTGVTDEALDAWCRARLAAFKVPRRFDRWPVLPRTAAGKLERHRLLTQFPIAPGMR